MKAVIAAILCVFLFLFGCSWERGARREGESESVSYIRHESGSIGAGPAVGYAIGTWPGFSPAACSITFDDGTLDQYLVAFPELERRGIKGSFYLITRYTGSGEWVDDNDRRLLINWDQARALSQSGHEIGGHTRTHQDLTAPRSNVRFELYGSYLRLKHELRDQQGFTMAWTYWRSDPDSRAIASQIFLAARGGTGVLERYHEKNHVNPLHNPFDYYQVGALGMRDTEYVKPWQQYGDTVLSEGGWFVLNFHGVDDGTLNSDMLGWQPISIARFRAILDWVQGRGFWVAPFGTAARYARERSSARLSVLESMENVVVMTLEDGLDDKVYDHPLSIHLELPPEWSDIEVVQHENRLPALSLPDGGIRFDALPDGSVILVHRKG